MDCHEIETYYSPDRIDSWLSRWAELRELASPTVPGVQYDARLSQPTPGRKAGDSTRYVDIMADIERAWCQFGRWSIEFVIVENVMAGWPLPTLADTWGICRRDVWAAYRRACSEMAERLGWRR